MTKDEALDVVTDAAEKWAVELVDYIIPGLVSATEESKTLRNYITSLNRLNEAFAVLGGYEVLGGKVWTVEDFTG